MQDSCAVQDIAQHLRAIPGSRHGILRDQSAGPLDTLTLLVRYLAWLSVGSPGMIEILGCFTLGWEKSIHAPFSGFPPRFGTPLLPGFPDMASGCSQNPPAPWPLSAPGQVLLGNPWRVDSGQA